MPNKEKETGILQYIDDPNLWKPWLMEGVPKPHEAAALLTNWLANFETSLPEHRIGFWTIRAAMFYNAVRWANYEVRGQWGEKAKFVDWNDFLLQLSETPEDTGLLFIPGKFRTLPTPNQVDCIRWGLRDLEDCKIISALIFDPRENVNALEGDRFVLDDRIRIWAYSQLPIDIVTRFPVIQEGKEVDRFYNDRYNEIRAAKKGYVGVGVGISNHRNKIIDQCQKIGVEVVDTATEINKSLSEVIALGDSTDFDKLSSQSHLANELIIKYLQNMGQI